jgi:hypothetical protein
MALPSTDEVSWRCLQQLRFNDNAFNRLGFMAMPSTDCFKIMPSKDEV